MLWLLLEEKEINYMNFQLNNQQYTLLTLIIQHPSSTTTKLAEKMNITKSAISQQLVKLEAEGYIIRKQNVEDKRTFSVELGEKGLLYKKECDYLCHMFNCLIDFLSYIFILHALDCHLFFSSFSGLTCFCICSPLLSQQIQHLSRI